jgi:transglutaminase-like putative cysteine protease
VSNLSDADDPEALLDHHAVAWGAVRRSRYWMHQRFQYRYPGKIRELRQRLMVIPQARYGDQRVCAFALAVSIPNSSTNSHEDAFGNRVFLIAAPEADAEVTFELRLIVERDLAAPASLRLSPAEVAPYLAPTPLTSPDATLLSVARRLAAEHADQEQLCEAISDWVFHAMRYGWGATTVNTTAAEALKIGQGLCQDYAHIMLALCHAAGVPARYVSGHMLGEGGSHAWVEALVPTAEGDYKAVALDPTNQRRITPAYITVATGRDYRDVSPTSGSYLAPYPGELTTSKRAGLTHLEYRGCAL